MKRLNQTVGSLFSSMAERVQRLYLNMTNQVRKTGSGNVHNLNVLLNCYDLSFQAYM